MRGQLVAGLVSGTTAILVVSAVALAQSTSVVTPASNDFLPPTPLTAIDAGTPPTPTVDAGAPDAEPIPAATPATVLGRGPAGESDAGTDATSNAPAQEVGPAPSPPPPPVQSEAADAGTPPSNVGFSVGLHGGYSIPHGNAGAGRLSYIATGVVPIGVDAGWFINPHLYVGGYFTYGIVTVADQQNTTCVESGESSCGATLLRFGAVAHWHFRPETQFDPWVGGGVGYEIINLSSEDDDPADADSDSNSSAQSIDGFTLSAEAGFDWKPLKYVGLGPYVEAQAGQYFSAGSASAIHEWLTFGLRVRTNL
jgi:opacity protein-like surface antigen